MFRPLLSATLTNAYLPKLKYPMYASPKLDGIRAIVRDGKLYSRNGKLIPNKWCQELFGDEAYNGFDGELIVGAWNHPQVYNKTSSGVMSQDGKPDVTYYIFDNADPNERVKPYYERQRDIYNSVAHDEDNFPRVRVLEQSMVNNEAELLAFETICLEAGFEGIMIRSLNGHYKWGRSSPTEGIIFKLKRFTDSEAEVIGMVELNSNQNEQTKDELGRSKRSHEKAGLVPMGTMGALIVRDCKTGVKFEIGSGFTSDQRDWWWGKGAECVGIIVTYKHFEIGVKNKPRFPTFVRIRKDGA
jgi:DNA ligase 1